MRRCARYVAALLCTVITQPLRAQTAAGETRSGPAKDAAAFMQAAESTLADLNLKVNRADWVAANFITDDTEALSADANRDFSVAVQRFAMSARRYEHTALPAELRRKFTLLKLSLSAPPPGNAAEATELAKLRVSMEAEYGKGAYCRPAPAGAATKEECLQINELSKILAH